MESPNCRRPWRSARKQGWHFDIMSTSFFLSRRSVRPRRTSGMPVWQDKLFIVARAQRRRRVELFPASDRPRGGDRHAGDGLGELREFASRPMGEWTSAAAAPICASGVTANAQSDKTLSTQTSVAHRALVSHRTANTPRLQLSELLGADPRLDRRRLWRHRHQPSLRFARGGARATVGPNAW